MNSNDPSTRINILCPNCRKDGSARAELLNRRVSCKHCSHVFRAVPVDGPDGSAAPPFSAVPGRDSSDHRIESLEREIGRLREDLAARLAAPSPAVDPTIIAGLREQLKRSADAAGEAEARSRAGDEEARGLRDRLADAIQDVSMAEARRVTAMAEADDRQQALLREIAGLREQLDQALRSIAEAGHDMIRPEDFQAIRDDLAKARAAGVEAEQGRGEAAEAQAAREAEHDRVLDELRAEIDRLKTEAEDRGRRVEAHHAEVDRLRDEEIGQLRRDLEGARAEAHSARDAHRADARHDDGLAAEVRDLREQLERERETLRDAGAGHASAIAEIRSELATARARLAESEAIRHQRDEARIQRDRISEEADSLRGQVEGLERLAAAYLARAEAAEERAARWNDDSTETELPHPLDDPGQHATLFDPESDDRYPAADLADDQTLFGLPPEDHAPAAGNLGDGWVAEEEAESLRASLADALAAGERQRAEMEALRSRLDQATATAEAATRSPRVSAPPEVSSAGPAAIESERRRAVDEAVKGAWADFERRLAETQAKLKAANGRADLLEAEAREAREQAAAFQRGLELGDLASPEDLGSMTSIRIMADRGTSRLTQAEADARLALARRLAVERKDKSLIDRIARMAEKVHADLEARNYTLADTLVRGAEIEAGIDPGGWSLGGLKIFRPSPSITTSLAALAPAFDRVMRLGDPAAIRSTVAEMRKILGDQAGLPEIRRPGRTPAVKRPIAVPEAVRLFLDAIEAEAWLIRPIAANRPLPDTAPGTYATLIEAAADARPAVERHAPDRLDLLDKIIKAAVAMLARRQQPDGHFSFLDPRGKASPAATVVEAMVAARPGAVKDGWVIDVDSAGMAQSETAACGSALARAGSALGKPELTQSAFKAADWTLVQPCLPQFTTNAQSASLLARAYLDGRKPAHLDGLIARVALGLLPGQVANGRWVDPAAAQTPNHLTILRALHDAWSAIPPDRAAARDEVADSITRAMTGLLEESARLGVPANGSALRDLIHHRDLFGPGLNARLGAAILDSATVVQELCHDGPKPKLGVPPDQLAALIRA